MFTSIISAAALLAAGTSAAPTSTTHQNPSRTVPLTGVTHTIVAGLGGLRFDPDNVVAEVGDIIQWNFNPQNHSVAQSNFQDPCEPLADGTSFFPGFVFPTQEGQSEDVFQLVIEDKETIWYYCPQTTGDHCQKGMVGVINRDFDNNDVTLDKHRELAAKTGKSIVPNVIQGGKVIKNPNP